MSQSLNVAWKIDGFTTHTGYHFFFTFLFMNSTLIACPIETRTAQRKEPSYTIKEVNAFNVWGSRYHTEAPFEVRASSLALNRYFKDHSRLLQFWTHHSTHQALTHTPWLCLPDSAPRLWASWIGGLGVERGYLIHWGLTLWQLGSPLTMLFLWGNASKEFITIFKKTNRTQAIINWDLTAFLSLKNIINNDRQTFQVSHC